MGRRPNWPPRLVQKPNTAEARTWHAGRWWTCGKWDVGRDVPTPAAKAQHARLIARWVADPGSATRPAGEYLLADLLADWCESTDGPATEAGRKRLRLAVGLLGPLLEAPAASLTPAALSAWRTGISAGRSRYTVKAYTLPVLLAYQWGEDSDRIPEGLAARLWAAVARRDTPGAAAVPRAPADVKAVAKVAKWLSSHRPDAAALFRVHSLTGARVEELLVLTAGDVRTRGAFATRRGARLDLTREGVWAADLLDRHKTAKEGKERVLVFGPKAQKVLAPLLRGKGPGEPLFPPLGKGGVYRASAYWHAVASACEGSGVPHFAPRALRQMVADRVRDVLGVEWAAAYLGHSGGSVTERHYLTLSLKKAAEAARAVG